MYTYRRPENNDNKEFTGYMVDEASIRDTKEVDYNSIYRSKEFLECMNYFDTKDNMTRKVLLSVNEADQTLMMQALAAKLYQHIVDKVDDVDFGSIPNSKGDITKIEKYEQLNDCLNVLSEVLQNYNQPTNLVDTVTIALQNLVDRRDLFVKAYRLNVEIPIVTYNTLALSVVSATSFLIASSIEFIKLPGDRGFDIAFDKTSKNKSKDKILYKNLSSFNNLCSNGQFDKTMEFVIKNNIALRTAKKESVEVQQEAIGSIAPWVLGSSVGKAAISSVGAGVNALGTALGSTASMTIPAWITTAAGAVGAVTGVVAALIGIILMIRELIYLWYYARTRLSDYFDAQSALLVMNAYNVEGNLTRDEKERKKIVEKQNRVAKFFSKLSDTLKVKDRAAEDKAQSDIDKENNTKYNYNDVVDTIPDSANAALF